MVIIGCPGEGEGQNQYGRRIAYRTHFVFVYFKFLGNKERTHTTLCLLGLHSQVSLTKIKLCKLFSLISVTQALQR